MYFPSDVGSSIAMTPRINDQAFFMFISGPVILYLEDSPRLCAFELALSVSLLGVRLLYRPTLVAPKNDDHRRRRHEQRRRCKLLNACGVRALIRDNISFEDDPPFRLSLFGR